MIKFIIFDFSQTLARADKPARPDFFAGLENLGLEAKTEKQAQHFLSLLPVLYDESESWPDFAEKFTQRTQAKIKNGKLDELACFFKKSLGFKLYEDFEEVQELPQRKAILTFTSKFLANLPQLHDFEIFTPKETIFTKPDLRAFLAVLEKMKADPEECVMVGDSLENDYLPAEALGMKAVLIDRTGKITDNSIVKIQSLKELKKYL